MRKLSFILAVLLLVCLPVMPLQANATGLRLYRVDSPQALLELAELCRLDSYSQGLLVTLTQDIDLSNTDFQGIPIFCGTFDGRGHTVSGFTVQDEGSFRGFFRYLTDTAVVEDLTVQGILRCEGSAAAIGGIVGQNAGTVRGCSFSGIASGLDNVGGVTGINTVSGIVEDCRVSGSITGKHFIGGLVGNNAGVIRNCRNEAKINTSVSENQVHLEDITMDSLTNSESAATVTDIGGICGTGTGVIRKCENHGAVGYPKLGFNVGGIAGSYIGFITDCVNYAVIAGRKDVGGIIGHLEPAVSLDFKTDTLQILRDDMQTMSELAGNTAMQAQSAAGNLQAQAESIGQHTDTALDALDTLLKDAESGILPDADALQAATNAVSGSISAITGILGEASESAQNSVNAISGGINAMSDQMDKIGATVNNATQGLGGKAQDVSDLDTEADISAKVLDSHNNGPVSGDLNVGGIVGAIGLENDLDPQSDLVLSGSYSANFELSFRAVILACENNSPVTGSKQHIGGIAGWASMGLIRSCVSRAALDASGADYTGGIAGLSYGFIRDCHARCEIAGKRYVGGIAGIGSTVTDCRSLVRIHGTERVGSILGYADTLENIRDNLCMYPDTPCGAIVGISYAGCAASVAAEDFFLLGGLPQDFDRVTVEFRLDGAVHQRIVLPYGFSLTQARIPVLPARKGYTATWSGKIGMLEPVYFDTVFEAVYTKNQTVLGSDLLSQNGSPRMLAQGSFTEDQQLLLTLTEDPDALYAWQIRLPRSETVMTLRLLLPDHVDSGRDALQVRCESGWKTVPYTQDGSYLVFACQEEFTQLRIVDVPTNYSNYWIAGGAALLMLLGIVVIILALKAFKKKA